MKRNSQAFNTMVSRITSGEISRRQAAAIYGINYGTLGVWLNRSNVNEATAFKGDAAKRGTRAGAALGWPSLPESVRVKLDEAADRVVAGISTAKEEADADPDIKLSTLNIRVRQRGVAMGLMQPRVKRLVPTPISTSADEAYLLGLMKSPKKLLRLAALARLAGV